MITPYIDQLNRRIRAGQQRECRLRKSLANEEAVSAVASEEIEKWSKDAIYWKEQERKLRIWSEDILAHKQAVIEGLKKELRKWRIFVFLAAAIGALVGMYWPW